jgi:hypothetical protein
MTTHAHSTEKMSLVVDELIARLALKKAMNSLRDGVGVLEHQWQSDALRQQPFVAVCNSFQVLKDCLREPSQAKVLLVSAQTKLTSETLARLRRQYFSEKPIMLEAVYV